MPVFSEPADALSRDTDSTQSTAASRQFGTFRMLVASTGTPQGPFGYDGGWGYQEDADSGLKLLGHRYYDASTGRFLTRDPAKDGRNWFAYLENDPATDVDDDGLQGNKKKHIPPAPPRRLGLSGKPIIDVVPHSSRKGAEDGARGDSAKGQPIIDHGDHFHGTDGKGRKVPVHHTWFEQVDWGTVGKVAGGVLVGVGVAGLIIIAPEAAPIVIGAGGAILEGGA